MVPHLYTSYSLGTWSLSSSLLFLLYNSPSLFLINGSLDWTQFHLSLKTPTPPFYQPMLTMARRRKQSTGCIECETRESPYGWFPSLHSQTEIVISFLLCSWRDKPKTMTCWTRWTRSSHPVPYNSIIKRVRKPFDSVRYQSSYPFRCRERRRTRSHSITSHHRSKQRLYSWQLHHRHSISLLCPVLPLPFTHF